MIGLELPRHDDIDRLYPDAISGILTLEAKLIEKVKEVQAKAALSDRQSKKDFAEALGNKYQLREINGEIRALISETPIYQREADLMRLDELSKIQCSRLSNALLFCTSLSTIITGPVSIGELIEIIDTLG